MLSSINRKNKAIILLFLIIVVILALITGIYFINERLKSSPTNEQATNEDLIELIKKFAEQNNINIDYQRMLNHPDSVTPDDIDRMKNQYIRHLKEIEFRTPFDFLTI